MTKTENIQTENIQTENMQRVNERFDPQRAISPRQSRSPPDGNLEVRLTAPKIDARKKTSSVGKDYTSLHDTCTTFDLDHV